ncbi:DWNN domain- a CCHC-type zinc finger [Striga hermonthica]|uniref:DWNN domain- a CCHC-type zinc finger n=1 Tax=Striga hermonthica TaxID=68872 RepID=A0A9N7RDH1_STRHE|nr:DWNN domain- a CCHC-type zinc finger [Striga hermonthica]
MAVYYKFKSAKDYDSVAIDGHFISVGHLKEKIFELKHLGRGTDFDLVVTNAQTNEEYLDEGMLIPKNTSVLIRRVPGRPRKAIVTAPVTVQEEANVENNYDDGQAVKGGVSGVYQPATNNAEDFEWDEFGNDLYAMPETVPVQSNIPVQDAAPVSKDDEESKIKALIDTPALDWQRQPSDGLGPGRGFGRGMGGRMMGGRGFGRGGFEKKTPPPGYICHRCKVPGHFIQHCPTNGDPTFDIKRVKPPTGIPKSMLMATPDGSYALPSGAVAVLKPNEAAFEKEIEGMPSTRSVGDLPPELHCPLCKEVMKDAVLTSKCCFTSFCDRCIRDHIISKSMCVCGATNILADDLLPNKTLRDTINRILESNNNSTENGGSAFQVQDMESRNPQAKVPSPTQSVASKGQQMSAPPPQREDTPKVGDIVEENKASNLHLVQVKGRSIDVPDVSEATHDSRTVKEAASRGSGPLADEEVQQKPVSGEAGKKKKKKKIRMPPGAPDMQWRNAQELVPENYMMPLGPSAFNPYWNGIQPGLDGFMPPPYGGPMPPYMGYGFNPMEVPFPGAVPHDPFGGPGCMFPYGPPQPQRDLAELAVGFNSGPPIMSREEFEARKADLKRKREMERRNERQIHRDGEYGREGSSTGYATSRSKFKPNPPPPSDNHHRHNRHSPELSRPSSKKKHETHPSPDPHQNRSRQRHSESPPAPPSSAADRKQKPSVFSRISFPENERKKPPSAPAPACPTGSSGKRAVPHHPSNGHHHHHEAVDNDSSDDERHFKRRRSSSSRYESPPPPAEEEHRRRSRDRERERHSKHR